MADVNANIGINIDTSQSLAEIKALQRQLAQLYTSINKGSAAAAAAQKGLATNLMNTINAGGQFYAQMGTVRTSTESFTHALEKNKLTMREYFRFAGGSTKTFGRLFKQEFDTIGKVAEERVKRMQTQYIKLGRDASGAMKAISITPTTLDMKNYGNQVAVAAQKQALLNQLLKQGSTNLLNFGKNTQWAGRQLMVGFTIPLAYLGTAAAKTFMELEQQALKFKRVYGDVFTTSEETSKALRDLELLSKEFTKYGVAAVKTMEMAASAAAMGKTGADLMAQVSEATRLAVLGNVEQEQALETTISLTNAFGIAAEDLTKKINFLNAVENQTVVSIEDLTIAIPKAGPVVQQLGGDVEDLAFFLTAMKEGGINASEGANALKSGLASLINPTKKASQMLADMGINIKGIVEANKGDVRATVVSFAKALDSLGSDESAMLKRAQAIEQLFGKFQFSRLSALFSNITKEGTQAARVLDLMNSSVEELAILSERELKAVEDAVGTNFKQAIEEIKLTLAPIGKEFLKAITPVIKFFANLFEKFNGLSDGAKKFIVVLTTLVGLVGPTLLMTFGLIANGAANIIKLFILMRQGFLKLSGNSTNLAQQTQYLNTEQQEAAIIAASLNQAHSKLTQQFTMEATAVKALRDAYVQATAAATRFAAANPGMMLPGSKGVPKGPIKGPRLASGTTEVVGGEAGKDSVPALLMPGEAVIPTVTAQDERFKPLVAALVSGDIAKYEYGTTNVGSDGSFTIEDRSGSQIRYVAKDVASAQRIVNAFEEQVRAASQPGGVGREQAITTLLARMTDKQSRSAILPAPSDLFKNIKEGRWRDSSGAPKWVKTGLDKLNKEDNLISALRNKEVRAVYKELVSAGVTDPKVFKNALSQQASHINPSFDENGQRLKSDDPRKWNTGQVVRDMGILNNYLNRTSNDSFQSAALKVLNSDEASRKLGLQSDQVTQLKRDLAFAKTEVHPTNPRQLEMIGRLAELDKALSAGGFYKGTDLAKNIYQAKGVSALIRTRLPKVGESKFYKNIVPRILDLETRKAATEIKVAVKPTQQVRDAATGRLVPQQLAKLTPEDKRRIPTSQRVSHTRALMMRARGQFIPPVGATADTGAGPGGVPLRGGGAGTPTNSGGVTKVQVVQNPPPTPEEQKAMKAQQMQARLGGASMAAGGVAMVGMMTGNTELAKFAGGLSAATGILAMLPPKFVGLGVAVMAVGLAVAKLRQEFDKTRREEIERRKKTGTSKQAIEGLATFANQASAGEIMDLRRKNKNQLIQNAPGKTTFGEAFVQTEQGKSTTQAFADQIAKDKGKLSTSVQDLTAQLSTAVVSGALTAEQARSVAMNLADELGNMSLGVQVSAKLNELLGPNGENILESPLDVATKLNAQSLTNVNAAAGRLSQSNSGLGKLVPKTKIGTMGSVAAAAGIGAGLGSVVPGIGTAIGATVGTLVGAGAAYFAQKNASKTFAARSGATIATIGNAMAQQQELSDALDVYYQKKIAEAQAEGDIAKAKELQIKYDKEKNDLAAQGQKLNESVLEIYKNAGSGQEALLNGVKEQIKEVYKGTQEAMFTGAANDLLQTARKSGAITSEQEALINFKMYSKEITPSQITTLMGMFEGKQKETQTVMSVMTKFGGKVAADMSNVLGLITDKEGNVNAEIQSRVLLAVDSAKTSADAQKIIDFTREIGKLGGIMDADVMIKYYLDNPEVAKELEKIIGDIDAEKDITKDIVYKINPILADDPKEVNDAFDEKYFESLKDEANQKVYTKTVSTLVKMEPSAIVQGDDYKKWLEEWDAKTGYGGKDPALTGKSQGFLVNEFIKDQGFKATQAGATDKTESSTTDEPKVPAQRDTTLDSTLKRLKFIRNASINEEGGNKELARITSGKGLNKFGGITQQLLGGLGKGSKGGFNRDFIDFLESMDKKTRALYMTVKNGQVVLTQNGKNLKEAFNEKAIGEYQVAQYRAIQDAKAQEAAFVKLKSAGVDTAQAMEMVSDASLAVAINGKSISSKELAKMAADAKKAANAQELFNVKLAASKSAQNLKTLEKTAQVLSKLSTMPGISQDALQRVAQSPELMNRLYKQIFEGAKKGAAEINQLLNDAAKERVANFRVQVNIDPATAIRSAIDARLGQAMSNMQAAVDAQTRVVSAPFLTRIADTRKQIVALKTSPANIQLNKDIALHEARIAQQQGVVSRLNSQLSAVDFQISAIQDQINSVLANATKETDAKIDKANKEVDALKQAVELEFDQPIRDLQRQIDKIERDAKYAFGNKIDELNQALSDLQRQIEVQFGRPIEILQRESTSLSRELADIEDIADKVNEKYNTQIEALDKVADLNAKINDSKKEQIDLADAITQGDIAAAARAAQTLKQKLADDARQAQRSLLESARNAELSSIRSKTGKTKSQITERQKQIDAEIRSIEAAQERFEKEKNILGIKDQIFALEKQREDALKATRDLQKQIDDLEEKRIPRLVEIENKERDILKLQADRQSAIAAAEASVRAMEAQIRTLEASKNKIAGEISEAQKALNDLETDKTYLDNKKKSDDLAKEVADLEAQIAAIEAEMEAALANDKTLQGLITTLENAQTAMAEAWLNAFKDTNQYASDMQKLANAAKEAAEAIAEILGTGKSGSDQYGLDPKDPDYMEKFRARAFSTDSSASGGSTGTGTGSGTSGKIKDVADALVRAKDPAKAVAASAKDMKDSIGKIQPLLEKITGYINTQFEKMPSIKKDFDAISKDTVTINTDMKTISDSIKNIKIKDFSEGIKSAAKDTPTIKTEWDKVKTAIDDAKNKITSGFTEAIKSAAGAAKSIETAWSNIKTAVSNAAASIDAFISKLSSALSVAQAIISTLNTSTVTKHTIETTSNNNVVTTYSTTGTPVVQASTSNAAVQASTSNTGLVVTQNPIETPKYYNYYTGTYQDTPVVNPFYESNGGLIKPIYRPMGGLIPYMANGGSLVNFKPLGTDTVPAMLTPGEFVMSRYAVDNFGLDRMKAINSGDYDDSAVYNYSINVNVESTSDADEIARTVITKIKQIDSQRIRTQRI